jgi:hypothetical protein
MRVRKLPGLLLKSKKKPLKINLSVALLLLSVSALPCFAQTQLFVPGNASGGFGNPIDEAIPFVSAITVTGPATITVTYISGTIPDAGGVNAGPNGVTWTMDGAQSPLQESRGVAEAVQIQDLDSLIGAFVPQNIVSLSGFAAEDGTKNLTTVGIAPTQLFFIGASKSFTVPGAGTLYLGINDWIVGDNSGGFTVQVGSTAK